jgi:hypothetical protein
MVVEQAADHDEEDEEEDQDALPVRLVAIALLRAAQAEQARGVRDQAPVEHVEDADSDEHLDRVPRYGERRAEQLALAEPGEAPIRVERPAVERDHLDHQDDEAPEDQRVHDPGGLLAGQELPLAEAVDRGAFEALGNPVEPRGRPRGQQEPRARGEDRGEYDQPDREHDRESDGTHPPRVADSLASLNHRMPHFDGGQLRSCGLLHGCGAGGRTAQRPVQPASSSSDTSGMRGLVRRLGSANAASARAGSAFSNSLRVIPSSDRPFGMPTAAMRSSTRANSCSLLGRPAVKPVNPRHLRVFAGAT